MVHFFAREKFLSLIALVAFAVAGCGMPTSEALKKGGVPSSYAGIVDAIVLIYTGGGSWRPEVDSLSKILKDHGVSYEQLDSDRINSMSLDELTRYNVVIIPGGNAPTVNSSLSAKARANLASVVKERGRSYLGFCAGAWLAVDPTYDVGFGDGSKIEKTSLELEGRPYALNHASFADGSQRDLLWFGGPITPNIAGGVVARYADGTPAITQLRPGNGFAIVSGLHPAATPAVLNSLALSAGEAVAPDYAWKMLEAAILKKPLPAF